MRSARNLLVVVPLAVVLSAGCQAIQPMPRADSSPKQYDSGWNRTQAEPKKAPFWKSWFVAEEPPPPKNMRDWMELEPIRL